MSASLTAPLAVAIPSADLPAASRLQVDTVSEYVALLELAPVWNRLVDEAGIDHPFLSHEWIRTWWECFGAGKQLHVLVVKAGGEPIAIAPLMRGRGRLYGLKVRWLQLIANVHAQRGDFIVGRCTDAAYRAIWEHLTAEEALWDVLVLPQVPAGSGTLERLPRLADEDGFAAGLWRSVDSPWLPLSGTWETYLSGLAAKHRSNLRNRMRRLEQLGPVALEVVSESGPALEDGLRLEAAAWKGQAGTAICCHPDETRFYTRLAACAAERGWLRLQFLTVGGRRIAFGYSLCYKEKLYLLKPGYAPDFARYSPSNLLCYMVLRDAFGSGIRAYDFLGADDPWKREWTSETKPHFWLFVFGNTSRARLIRFAKFSLVPWLKRSYVASSGLAHRAAVAASGAFKSLSHPF
jgi:CelD/BcsL family acetyltransferase involved in cellulose biosynthesis